MSLVLALTAAAGVILWNTEGFFRHFKGLFWRYLATTVVCFWLSDLLQDLLHLHDVRVVGEPELHHVDGPVPAGVAQALDLAVGQDVGHVKQREESKQTNGLLYDDSHSKRRHQP